jgi:hypothetical protein
MEKDDNLIVVDFEDLELEEISKSSFKNHL